MSFHPKKYTIYFTTTYLIIFLNNITKEDDKILLFEIRMSNNKNTNIYTYTYLHNTHTYTTNSLHLLHSNTMQTAHSKNTLLPKVYLYNLG